MNSSSVLSLIFQDLFSFVWLYLGARKMAARFITTLYSVKTTASCGISSAHVTV